MADRKSIPERSCAGSPVRLVRQTVFASRTRPVQPGLYKPKPYKPRLRRAPLAPLVQPKVEQERLRRLALRAVFAKRTSLRRLLFNRSLARFAHFCFAKVRSRLQKLRFCTGRLNTPKGDRREANKPTFRAAQLRWASQSLAYGERLWRLRFVSQASARSSLARVTKPTYLRLLRFQDWIEFTPKRIRKDKINTTVAMTVASAYSYCSKF